MKRNAKTIIAGMIALTISHTAMADDIKVAVVGAMSGPIAQWGDMEFNGARQAIKDINAKGGIKGDKLVGVEYDDACDPKQAVAVANKIVNDGIKYVIGHLCSSSTQPASDIYEDEGILMISPGATNPELTQRGYQYIMRTAGLDSSQGPTAAKYILETVKPQRIAIIHDKQSHCLNSECLQFLHTLPATSNAVHSHWCRTLHQYQCWHRSRGNRWRLVLKPQR